MKWKMLGKIYKNSNESRLTNSPWRCKIVLKVNLPQHSARFGVNKPLFILTSVLAERTLRKATLPRVTRFTMYACFILCWTLPWIVNCWSLAIRHKWTTKFYHATYLYQTMHAIARRDWTIIFLRNNTKEGQQSCEDVKN